MAIAACWFRRGAFCSYSTTNDQRHRTLKGTECRRCTNERVVSTAYYHQGPCARMFVAKYVRMDGAMARIGGTGVAGRGSSPLSDDWTIFQGKVCM
jgi:hypothetical protein